MVDRLNLKLSDENRVRSSRSSDIEKYVYLINININKFLFIIIV